MRLIDADKLKGEFIGEQELWHYTGIRACIDSAPTVDAVAEKGTIMTDRKQIARLICDEYDDIITNHGTFNTDHEAYAVLKEEVEETGEELDAIDAEMVIIWHDIREDKDINEHAERIYQYAISLIQEAVQVAAVALKAKYSNAVRGDINCPDLKV